MELRYKSDCDYNLVNTSTSFKILYETTSVIGCLKRDCIEGKCLKGFEVPFVVFLLQINFWYLTLTANQKQTFFRTKQIFKIFYNPLWKKTKLI